MNAIKGLIIVIVTGTMIVTSGCARSRTQKRDASPAEAMQNQADAIQAAGGLATVGMGSSRTMHLAIEKAKTRGRNELAHLLEGRIEVLHEAFMAEIGDTDDDDYRLFFTTAANTLATQILRGAIPRDMQHETSAGMTTAWVLMAHDPKHIAEAFAAQADIVRHPYTRFRASQTYEELAAAIEAFSPYRR